MLDTTIEKVEAYIRQENLIENGDVIIAGVSGGADSVCMLTILHELSKTMNISVIVVHVNHQIRGEEADNDEKYVRDLAIRYNMKFEPFDLNVAGLAKNWKMSVEEAGRKVRYGVFDEMMNYYKGNKIAVAHNANDLAETVLFNMVRGSNLHGMTGISSKRGNVIRPILCLYRDEIESFLHDRDIDYCIDSTNTHDDYSRNKLRLNVMPELNRINDQATRHIGDIAVMAKQYVNYVDKIIDTYIKEVAVIKDGSVELDIDKISSLEDVILDGIIYKTITIVSGKVKDVTRAHVQTVKSLLSANTGKMVSLPYDLLAFRSYNDLIITNKNNKAFSVDNIAIELLDSGTYHIDDLKYIKVDIHTNDKNIVYSKFTKNLYTKTFDYDKINQKLVLRHVLPNDYLIANKEGATKKLNRYFIDEKVPRPKRKELLVIADGNHVLWIIGMRISEYYKIDDSTTHVIEINYIDEGEE